MRKKKKNTQHFHIGEGNANQSMGDYAMQHSGGQYRQNILEDMGKKIPWEVPYWLGLTKSNIMINPLILVL